MSKLDSDVRSLINYLYFEVSSTWDQMMWFLWSPDTKPDADFWVEPGVGTNEVQLKKEIREFVIQTDAQMQGLPSDDFVFSYPITERLRRQGDLRLCFLAMPTKDWLPDVQRTIEAAAAGFECKLSVDNAAPGDIMNQVWQDIRRSEAVVADLTDKNPNVFYEMGLAHALGKTTIIIKQKETPPVPFDLRNYRHFEYDPGNLEELKAWLRSAFLSVPRRYSFDR
ncbi:MAG: nucleoside 2-deoxyribosyltransferase [Acidobacteriia bacterium]|nr:nucleoside 2-deoxyribosyltransferase [Terriglobia bacterium]